MNYYEKIKNKLIDNEIHSKVKDYSKERHTVITYFEIGKILSEAGKHYGENIIGMYAKKLSVEVNKKYNRRTLFRMKQFYNIFNDAKVSTLSTQLTWSHYTELLPIKDRQKLQYYLSICIKNNIGVHQLRAKIKSKEYERLDDNTKLKLMNKENTTIVDLIPNPILIKTKNKYNDISEKVLQKLILEDIPSFLEQLGEGFTFIKNEYKIKIGEIYNFLDILLFNYIYNCFVVVELKVTPLRKEHIGQIQIYMNYIDINIKNINHNKTIGLIIVKENNQYIIKYSSDSRIISRTYELV